MIAFAQTETQETTFVIPTMGKDKRGNDVPLEGPIRITIDNQADGFCTVAPDPADPTGFTVLVTSTITESTPGAGPWITTGVVAPDGRAGEGVKPVPEPFQVTITPSTDATSFVVTVNPPREIGTPPAPSPAAAPQARRGGSGRP